MYIHNVYSYVPTDCHKHRVIVRYCVQFLPPFSCIVDPCESGPCLNGGTCHAIYALTAAGIYCACRDGFGGLLCQLKQNIVTQTIICEFVK